MWSIKILTISIKRRYLDNNVLSRRNDLPVGEAEIPRAIRGQQIVFRTRPCGNQPSTPTRTATLFYSMYRGNSLRLVRSRRHPFFSFFLSFSLRLFNHPSIEYLDTALVNRVSNWSIFSIEQVSLLSSSLLQTTSSRFVKTEDSEKYSFQRGTRKRRNKRRRRRGDEGSKRYIEIEQRNLEGPPRGSIGWKSGCFTNTTEYHKSSWRARASANSPG